VIRVFQLGEPEIRKKSVNVTDIFDPQFLQDKENLVATLTDFREKNGFGRGISAPQIGVHKRFISLNLGDGSFTIINPMIINKSEDTFSMWDDCMSFPDLMVKLKRFKSISIEYINENDGSVEQWLNIDQSVSELLQHEIDHLDGVLAVDRALDKESIVQRVTFERNIQYYSSMVDYVIVPTL